MGLSRWIKRRFKAHPFLSLLAVLILLLALFAGAAEYTSRPRFCLTCHYMKPFYDSWAASEHHNVTCIKCHFEPGFRSKIRGKMQGLVQLISYVTRAYRRHKPVAEISDASCLRAGCHADRKLTGPLIFKGVSFDHAEHLGDLRRGKKLRCVSCHSQIVQGEHMKVTEGTCFVCHFKVSAVSPRPATCSACHVNEASPDALMNKRFSHVELAARKVPCESCHDNVVIGQGNVPKENCYTCHWETARLEKYDDTDLIHRTHIVEHKIECLDCHEPIEHRARRTIESMTLNCSSCHDASHSYVRELFAGIGGIDQTSAPVWTLHAGVGCQGCHVVHETAGSGKAAVVMRPAGCAKCHEAGFSRILEEWNAAIAAKLGRANAMLAEVKGVIDASTDPAKKATALAAYDKAQANLTLVEEGKAIHNITYADKLIRKAFEQMGEALAAVGSSRQVAPADLAAGPATPCTKCHYGIEEISRTVFDEPYDHRRHVLAAKLDCAVCHSDKPVHGALIVAKTDCASCHHQADSCDACHAVQRAAFQGTSSLAPEPTPSDMFKAEVICTDCHLDESGQVIQPKASVCLDCHKEGYDKLMGQWQTETEQSLTELAKRIEEVAALGADPARDEALSKARAVLDFVKNDKSLGVHNPHLIKSMIEANLEALSRVSGQ
jgi:nitrate/TMAO reductase-like tetraheme cytochrome c subunit